jgi:transcriptional regulator with XRE-family HTH domain
MMYVEYYCATLIIGHPNPNSSDFMVCSFVGEEHQQRQRREETIKNPIFVAMTNTDTPKTIHHGRNIKRLRNMLGVKQETLAEQLGQDWSQRRVSVLEDKDEIEPALLKQIAEILKVPVAAIENFDEEATVSIICNTFHDESSLSAYSHNYNYKCTFNPDKLMEALDENKKLYEALLKSEREKVAMLEKMLGGKKK